VSDVTRRGFVKSGAAAAAGATVIGGLAAEQAEAAGSEPLVAYVSDPNSGEISVMSGDRETTVRDKNLAARIARAAR
jgi:anti-sigma-K factor RskA